MKIKFTSLLPLTHTSTFCAEWLATGDGVSYGGKGKPFSGGLSYFPIGAPDASISVLIQELHKDTEVVLQQASAFRTAKPNRCGFTFTFDNLDASGRLFLQTGKLEGFRFPSAPFKGSNIRASYYYLPYVYSQGAL